MAKKTIQERLIAGLTALGETQVTTRSTRYTVFTGKSINTLQSNALYFVGKAGALRVGRTAGESRPALTSTRVRILGAAP